jgi:hypothetical protein
MLHGRGSMTARALAAVVVCAAAGVLLAAAQDGWRPDPVLVEQLSAKQPDVNYDESRAGSYVLPDALKAADGSVVRSTKGWGGRRTEILELFREHVYGRSPGTPERVRFERLEHRTDAMAGTATLERVAIISSQAGREHRFELTLFLPITRRRPVPVFLLINNRPATNTDPTRREKSGFWPAERLIDRGYGIAAIQVSDLAPDDKAHFRDGVIRLFEGTTEGERPANAWAALAAWAWGASRAMDYLVTDPLVDSRKIALVGHSRGGKAALWAGAEDERFALVVSNESGEGGAALSRRKFGETLARITEVFPHWFARNYAAFAGRETALPIDQHMLLSLIAPRALYVASADQDLWSDPRGEFQSLAMASPVFALWRDPRIAADAMPPIQKPLAAGRRGYHIRAGTHNLTPYDWDRFVDFADALWN